jgi:hypothetical protein
MTTVNRTQHQICPKPKGPPSSSVTPLSQECRDEKHTGCTLCHQLALIGKPKHIDLINLAIVNMLSYLAIVFPIYTLIISVQPVS